MPFYKVIATETYLKEVSKLDKSEREDAEKVPQKLALNPFAGKPLHFPFLREKRIREKRLYYLLYEDLSLVIMVAVSGKKNQQQTIDYMYRNLEGFRKLAEELVKQPF